VEKAVAGCFFHFPKQKFEIERRYRRERSPRAPPVAETAREMRRSGRNPIRISGTAREQRSWENLSVSAGTARSLLCTSSSVIFALRRMKLLRNDIWLSAK